MTEPISAITSSPTHDQIQELALQNQELAVQTQELAHQTSIIAASSARDTVNLSATALARVMADETHAEQTRADTQATQRADEARAEQRSIDTQRVIHEYQVLANETAAVQAADQVLANETAAADQARSQSAAAATP